MEAVMSSHASKHDGKYGFSPDLETDGNPDALGRWFAGAVIVAFLAAGVIVYRTATPEVVTKSNDGIVASAATHSSPPDIPPAYSHVEGIDP
jgi:hypothetical protein